VIDARRAVIVPHARVIDSSIGSKSDGDELIDARIVVIAPRLAQFVR
jgi:hypothetical protein